MKTQIIKQEDAHALEQALAVLARGGMVVFPTDTIYGLGVAAFNEDAIGDLYKAKERALSKAIAVLIGEPDQLPGVASAVTPEAQRLAEQFWPGALTLVLPIHPALPKNLSPLPTIGVRIPDHPFARTLLLRAGALATTSANLSGGDNPGNVEEVLRQLEGRVELVIDGGQAPGGVPSTVVDCTRQPPVILRHGAIPEEAIRAVLAKI